jgi:hypothetical protein
MTITLPDIETARRMLVQYLLVGPEGDLPQMWGRLLSVEFINGPPACC